MSVNTRVARSPDDEATEPGIASEPHVGRIVIVEDDSLFAMYLQYVLEHEGHYQAFPVESGDKVLALSRDPDTAALVLDVSLRQTRLDGRHVDGLELSRRVKSDPDSANVPVILLTAHSMPGDRERFLNASRADAFISKPIANTPAFLTLIAELVARARRTR